MKVWLFPYFRPPKREDTNLEDDCYGNGVESDYSAARTAGEQLYDCKELYPKCPLGHGLFDIISVLTTSEWALLYEKIFY